MRKGIGLLLAAGLWAVLYPQMSPAFELLKKPCCEPGYTIVEEIVYKDVIKKRCVPAPGVQKKVKWVYDCISEDFCVPKCACPLHGLKRHNDCDKCASCLECSKPMTKKVLVKRMVVEECPADKCVVETYVEKVPCVIYHKVPCGAACPTTAENSAPGIEVKAAQAKPATVPSSEPGLPQVQVQRAPQIQVIPATSTEPLQAIPVNTAPLNKVSVVPGPR